MIEAAALCDRDIRELAQSIATLEVVVTGFIVATLGDRHEVRNSIAARLRSLADAAVYQLDGLEPSMLDRVADRVAADHAARSRTEEASSAAAGPTPELVIRLGVRLSR